MKKFSNVQYTNAVITKLNTEKTKKKTKLIINVRTYALKNHTMIPSWHFADFNTL